MLTMEAAIAMYDVSLHLPFFWVDDVWATGMVPPRANVTMIHANRLFSSLYLVDTSARYQIMTNYIHYYLFGHFPGRGDVMIALWHNLLAAEGFKIANQLPSWTYYERNSYFPKESYAF